MSIHINRTVSPSLQRDAGLLTWVGLRVHPMMCSHFRRYARQVGLMGDIARQVWGSNTVDPPELKELEAKILAESRKTPGTADQKE